MYSTARYTVLVVYPDNSTIREARPADTRPARPGPDDPH
eukprot:COSAG03_NODE_11058_length_613_cov_6.778210_1_plen_38_part_10